MANAPCGIWGLYGRVSDPKQDAEGLSVDAQLLALREWARSKGVETREYSDRGRSAWIEDITKRPEFKRMLDDAHTGILDGVAVTHIDRFSRKLIVTLTVLGDFGKHGVGFVSLENAAFDFSRPADRLLLAVLGAFAQYYSDELSNKVRRGLALRASKGLKVGSLEFGYCNGRCVDCKHCKPPCPRWETVPKDSPALLHPDDAQGVVLAFKSYREGNASYEDIATTLNSAGYRSRTPRGRVLWNRHSVAEMLRNVSYTGVIMFNGQEIPGKHPPIISRDLFDEVQALRRKRSSHAKLYNRRYRVYLFNGLLKCCGCGRLMRAQTKGRPQRLRKCYHCTSHELRHVECSKPSVWLEEDPLAEQFERIIGQFRLPEDWRARVCELLHLNGKQQNAENDRRTLTDRLARLKQQFEWGDIAAAEYTRKRDEIKAALSGLKTPEVTEIVNAADFLQNMAHVWQAATDEERRDMTRAILEELVCDPERKRLITLKPKPAFRLLFRQIPGLVEREGTFEIVGEE